jgi:ATP-dependent helicase/nuclease subunit A
LNFEKARSLKTDATVAAESDSVRFLTIHESKGLEFPAVIFVGCGKRFNFEDLRKDYILNNDYGLGIKGYDIDNYIKKNTLVLEAIKIIESKELLQEELRKLYVALTRAESYLSIIGQFSGINEINQKNYLDFIIPALVNDPNEFAKEFNKRSVEIDSKNVHFKKDQIESFFTVNFINNQCESVKNNINNVKKVECFSKPVANPKLEESLKRSFKYKNINKASEKLPFRTSVSKAKADITLEFEDSLTVESYEVSDINFSAGVDPRLLGIAYHKVFEILINEKIYQTKELSVESIKKTVKAKIANNQISQAEYNWINFSKIHSFYTNKDISKILSNAKIVKAEQKFDLNYLANKISKYSEVIDDTIIVQGIIDLLVIDKEGKAYIIDYKLTKPNAKDLLEMYKKQLYMYKEAVTEILNYKNVDTYLYYIASEVCEKVLSRN